jgi:hypothetical protein
VAALVGRLARRLAARGMRNAEWGQGITYALLIGLLAVQLGPALAQSYAMPKDDYRGAAAQIAATSPADSVVLTLNMGSTIFATESLDYYFWLRRWPIRVVDGAKLDYQTALGLAQGRGVVWAADFSPGEEQSAGLSAAGLIAVSFGHFNLVRPPPAPPLDQARRLLQWGSARDPRLLTSLAWLTAVASPSTGGANLLSPATVLAPPGVGPRDGPAGFDRWGLDPGAALRPGGEGFRLTTQEQEVNVTLTTGQLQAGRAYAVFFRYRNPDLQGAQRVYISALAADQRWLDVFPDGLGYACPAAGDWARQGFAFTVPAATTTVILWLRVTGRGSAEFADVELRPLP